jgi:hypothetical protein
MQYQAELTTYAERFQVLEQNGSRAFALIMQEYCSSTMRHRVENHRDYETSIIDDPIELLKAITILMHDPVSAKYPYAVLTDTLSRFLNTKQQEGESLLDYAKRCKQQRDVIKTSLGKDFLDDFVENTTEYHEETDTAKKDAMKDAWNDGPDTFSSRTATNPNTEAYSMVWRCNIHWVTHSTKQRTTSQSNNKDTNPKDKRSEAAATVETNFAQTANFCYCCGDKNHKADKCPERGKRAPDDWVIHKAQAHVQQEEKNNKESAHAQQQADSDDQSETSEGAISALTARSRCTSTSINTRGSRKKGWQHMQMNLLSHTHNQSKATVQQTAAFNPIGQRIVRGYILQPCTRKQHSKVQVDLGDGY